MGPPDDLEQGLGLGDRRTRELEEDDDPFLALERLSVQREARGGRAGDDRDALGPRHEVTGLVCDVGRPAHLSDLRGPAESLDEVVVGVDQRRRELVHPLSQESFFAAGTQGLLEYAVEDRVLRRVREGPLVDGVPGREDRDDDRRALVDELVDLVHAPLDFRGEEQVREEQPGHFSNKFLFFCGAKQLRWGVHVIFTDSHMVWMSERASIHFFDISAKLDFQ